MKIKLEEQFKEIQEKGVSKEDFKEFKKKVKKWKNDVLEASDDKDFHKRAKKLWEAVKNFEPKEVIKENFEDSPIDETADAIGEATPEKQLNFKDSDKPVEIDPIFGNVKFKRKNNKTLLIDADTIVVISCIQNQKLIDLSDKFFDKKKKKQEKELKKHLENATIYVINDISKKDQPPKAQLAIMGDKQEILDNINNKISSLVAISGCKDYKLILTGSNNFRYEIEPEYKSNRKIKYAGVKEIKELLINEDKYPTISYPEDLEADEIIVALKKAYKNDYIIASVDKDILGQVAGEHFRYYQSDKYAKSAEWVRTTYHQEMYNRFAQAITGDGVDGIKGLVGVGAKGAEKALAECKTQADFLNATIALYKGKMGDSKETMEYLAKQLNLVDMQVLQVNKKTGEFELKLWYVTSGDNLSRKIIKRFENALEN